MLTSQHTEISAAISDYVVYITDFITEKDNSEAILQFYGEDLEGDCLKLYCNMFLDIAVQWQSMCIMCFQSC